MKNLLLYARICPTPSQFSIKIFNEFQNLENLETRILDASEPFNPEIEQKYLKQFDNIILLFPINWFNIPWNLSRYMAEVWRTGEFNFQNQKLHVFITTGAQENIYSSAGLGYDVKEYFNNLFSVAKRLKTEISTFEYFYGCATKSPNDKEFLDFIDNLKNIYINKINK